MVWSEELVRETPVVPCRATNTSAPDGLGFLHSEVTSGCITYRTDCMTWLYFYVSMVGYSLHVHIECA